MAACAHLRISPQLLEHTQIPELRVIVTVRLPLAGAPGVVLPSQPTTVDALLQAGWRPDLVPHSQGWGPQDPKRAVGPPFSGTLSLLSPTGYVPLFCFRPPPPCPWAAAVPEVPAPDQSKAPALWPVSAGNGGYLAQRCPYSTRCLATTGFGARHKPRLLVSFSCRPAELPRGLLPSGSSPLGRGPYWPPASFPCRPITY